MLKLLLCTVLLSHITRKWVKGSGVGSYESSLKLLELVKFENKIADAVDAYVETLEQRLELTKAYAKELKESSIFPEIDSLSLGTQNDHTIALNSAIHTSAMAEITSDPLLTFKLLRRHVSDLLKIEKIIHSDHERSFMRVIEKHRKGTRLPTQKDLDTMTEGILRVHDAYNIDLYKFTAGNFGEIQRNSTLKALDCYLIGKYALKANIYTRAIEWLEMAEHLAVQESQVSNISEIRQQLKTAIKLHNQAWTNGSPRSPYVYQSLIHQEEEKKASTTGRKRVLDNSDYEFYKTQSSFSDLTNFAKLCRQEHHNFTLKRRMKCWLSQDTPYGTISPYKVEQLHEGPNVLQIYDVLPQSIMTEIKKDASGSFVRSQVYGRATETHKTVSSSRTSFSSWIKSPSISQKLAEVYQKLESLLKLDFNAKDALENLQVTKYDITGHYNPHLDNIMTPEFASNLSPAEINKGERIATLMFYLSDDMAGGLTAFPRIGVSAHPVAGSALFWLNIKDNGDTDQLSLHGGCPVIYGHKWVANQWIRANSQMFTRPCYKHS